MHHGRNFGKHPSLQYNIRQGHHHHLCLRDPLEAVLHQGHPVRWERRHLDSVQAENIVLLKSIRNWNLNQFIIVILTIKGQIII